MDQYTRSLVRADLDLRLKPDPKPDLTTVFDYYNAFMSGSKIRGLCVVEYTLGATTNGIMNWEFTMSDGSAVLRTALPDVVPDMLKTEEQRIVSTRRAIGSRAVEF